MPLGQAAQERRHQYRRRKRHLTLVKRVVFVTVGYIGAWALLSFGGIRIPAFPEPVMLAIGVGSIILGVTMAALLGPRVRSAANQRSLVWGKGATSHIPSPFVSIAEHPCLH